VTEPRCALLLTAEQQALVQEVLQDEWRPDDGWRTWSRARNRCRASGADPGWLPPLWWEGRALRFQAGGEGAVFVGAA
jgi:hypothetical protein